MLRLNFRWLTALTAVLFLSATGCRKDSTKAAKFEPPKQETPKADPPKGEAKSDGKGEPKVDPVKLQKAKDGIGRKFEILEVQQVMTNLKVAHANVFAEKNRGPTMDEILIASENNPKIVTMLKDGYIEMVWKSLKADDPANTALAWEFAPDNKGLRVVMTADYDIRPMQEHEFKKLTKAPAKK